MVILEIGKVYTSLSGITVKIVDFSYEDKVTPMIGFRCNMNGYIASNSFGVFNYTIDGKMTPPINTWHDLLFEVDNA